MPLRDDELLWDIEEQHLDEGEFLFGAREATLDAPHYTLSEVAGGYEARVLTHVDALVLGGPLVAERLLLPTIEDPDQSSEKIAIATLAIYAGSPQELCERALAVLDSATEDEQRRGVVRALELVGDAQLDHRLIQTLTSTTGSGTAARLEVLGRRQVVVGAWLRDCLVSDDPEVARAAARLARYCSDRGSLDALAPLAQAPDPELRRTAVETALCRQVGGSWESAAYWAFCPSESAFRRDALIWVALLGDGSAHQRLLGMIDRADARADALWAVGFAGRMSGVDRCIELLGDDRLGALAAEVICAIAGLPTDEDRYWRVEPAASHDPDVALPLLKDDDLDADLVPESEDALPTPEPEAIAAWWRVQRDNFDPELRYLGGRALNGNVLVDALRHGPMRRRHSLALELAMRTSGSALVNTRALGREQQSQLEALPELDAIDWQRGLVLR